MKFKEGDRCRVIGNIYAHDFDVGDIVIIKQVNNDDYYAYSRDPYDTWLITDEELEPATPMEIASTLTTKKADELTDPFKQQVGGDHYKSMAIQPVEFILANDLGFCEGNAIKYLCRYRQKGGVQDLEKARHYVDLLIDGYNKGKQ